MAYPRINSPALRRHLNDRTDANPWLSFHSHQGGSCKAYLESELSSTRTSQPEKSSRTTPSLQSVSAFDAGDDHSDVQTGLPHGSNAQKVIAGRPWNRSLLSAHADDKEFAFRSYKRRAIVAQKFSLRNLSQFGTPPPAAAATHANVRSYTSLRCLAVNSKRAASMAERGSARPRIRRIHQVARAAPV